MGRIGQWFGKVLYRGFIEEFPDLVSIVSEVSTQVLTLENRATLQPVPGPVSPIRLGFLATPPLGNWGWSP